VISGKIINSCVWIVSYLILISSKVRGKNQMNSDESTELLSSMQQKLPEYVIVSVNQVLVLKRLFLLWT